jgi:hypothetical protein
MQGEGLFRGGAEANAGEGNDRDKIVLEVVCEIRIRPKFGQRTRPWQLASVCEHEFEMHVHPKSAIRTQSASSIRNCRIELLAG